MVKIIWTEIAKNDINEIHNFIAQDSKRYASITVHKIYNRSQSIIKSPFIGRVVPEFNNASIRELISGKYRIVYKIISENIVHILRIYHSARLLDEDRI